MAHVGGVDRQATVLSDCSAAWHVVNGTVYVDTLCKGRKVIGLGGLELGKCLAAGMPRRLWNRVLFEFETRHVTTTLGQRLW
ncbi:hypothetical protein F5X71_34495 [Nocardia brasiliensis]|uniref:Uncharacterized protein n=1 Tax=Nocardia brasiliensis TaxID=37326 RepID=A0A6G9Y0L1_NOCBR|nr:hypothetical protein [Nocardia brasiliensis]QIS06738.1 hypothetical protein F5X71_34495 [Nocardia brasiliensis]